MSVTWFEKQDLIPHIITTLEKVPIVMDIGCGICPQQYIRPIVHICCEPFPQYINVLQNKIRSEYDRNYIIIQSTWEAIVTLFPPKSVDSIFLLDIIEHLEKSSALNLLRMTEIIARKQIIVFTPLGFLPQTHQDQKDAWGLNGGAWQEHKSGWYPEDFDDSWKIYGSQVFHEYDNLGGKFQTPYGALWAIKNITDNELTLHNKSGFQNFQFLNVLDQVIDMQNEISHTNVPQLLGLLNQVIDIQNEKHQRGLLQIFDLIVNIYKKARTLKNFFAVFFQNT